jgi:hypothetical protein
MILKYHANVSQLWQHKYVPGWRIDNYLIHMQFAFAKRT